ncbi:hypothetical protein [Corynebacterium oculi]|uniref:Uncharacterized protein n=1 Tax=Corynebacterium oculi TaxID=1544416 RepID=A0A0Q1A8I7_9CORY|nr:hypothetical protein [Corynebacterium oculi]KQB83083.1 hypothetical protein Cocul_02055 [Corynebacterium oculi]
MSANLRKSAVEALLFSLIATVVMNWPVTDWAESGYRLLGVATVFIGTSLILFAMFVGVRFLAARRRA